MQAIFTLSRFKLSAKVLIAVFAALGLVLFFVPRVINQTRAEDCQVFEDPVFNPFTESLVSTGCTDFPVLSVRNTSSSNYNYNVNLIAGEEGYVRIYVHNGAGQGLDRDHTIMHNVNASFSMSKSGDTYYLSSTLTATARDTAVQPKSGSSTITVPSGATLEVVPGSGEVDNGGSFDPTSGNISIGDQEACFPFARQYRFKVRVVAPQVQSSVQAHANASEFCVYTRGEQPNQAAFWTVQGSSNLAGKMIVWSSTKNGQSTGENNSFYNQYLDGSSQWSGTAHAWNNDDIGQWTKTVSVVENNQILASNTVSFTVKDCSTAPQPASGSVTAQQGSLVCSEGLYHGTYSWEHQNVVNPRVIIRDEDSGHQETVPVSTSPGSNSANWLTPNHHYTFKLIGDNFQSQVFDLYVGPANCQQNYTVNASANANDFCVYSRGEQANQAATWTVTGSSNLAGKKVVWSSTKNGQPTGESNSYYGHILDGSAAWSGKAHDFTTGEIGTWTKTASIIDDNNQILVSASPFTFTVRDCSTTPPPPSYSVSAQVNASDFCVYSRGEQQNQNSQWTVTASSNLAGKKIIWTSTKNGQPTGENNSYYGHVLDGGGAWSGPGRTWALSDIGSWTKTASVIDSNNQIIVSASPVSFTVRDCSTPIPELQCTPSDNPTVDPGAPVTFNALGGTGTYAWTSTSGQSGNSQSFSASFTQTGSQSATVRSGDKTATCSVNVRVIPPPEKTFTVDINNFCVGTNATYQIAGTNNLANKGIRVVSDSGPEGYRDYGVIATTDGNARAFLTGRTWAPADIGHWKRTFTIDGVSVTKEFDVRDCSPAPTTLTCAPQSQTATSGQTVSFSASGGNAPYTWTTTNGQNGSGTAFSATFSQSGSATVRSNDGQSAVCNVTVNPPSYSVSAQVNSNSFCVYSRGEQPNQNSQWTVTASQNLAGKQIVWSSTKDTRPTGENNLNYGHTLDGNAQWSGPGRTWTLDDIGSWTKTASVIDSNNQIIVSASPVSFTVRDCSTPIPELQCTPSDNPTVDPRAPVTFNALGGTGTYAWTSTSGQSGNSQSFSASFTQTGSQSATVRSGDKTATCSVNVRVIPPPEKTFTVDINNFCVGTNATYQIAGTNNLANKDIRVVSDSGPEGYRDYGVIAATDGNARAFLTGRTWAPADIGHWKRTFSIDGVSVTKEFDVRDCSPAPTTLTCAPQSQTATSGQTVSFSASGGNTPYTWTTTNGQNGSGTAFSAAFSQTGSATVRSNDGQTAVCNVTVTVTPPPALQCTPNNNPTVDPGAPVTFSASGGTGTYAWTSTSGQSGNSQSFSASFTQSGSATVRSGGQSATCNVTVRNIPPPEKSFTVVTANFCVGTNTTYQITGTSNLANQGIRVVSDSGPEGYKDYGVIAATDGNARAFLTGRTWAPADIGHWKRTFTIDGVSVSTEFDVRDCTPPPGVLVCTPQSQTAGSGQTVSFSATGGTGTYSWISTSGRTGSGSSFSASFTQSGSATVRSSDGQSATCNVVISVPTLACVPQNQNATAGQQVNFVASGGNGSYTWTSTGGRTGSGANFSTSFDVSGSATVRSSDGQSATCNVTISLPPPPPQLQCLPSNNPTVDPGAPVTFVASGGTGTYAWTATSGQTGNSQSFVAAFSQSGSATVRSGDQSATCNVTVRNVPPPQKSFSVIVNNFCVGTNPSFVFTATSNLANKEISAVTNLSPAGTQNHGTIGSLNSSATATITGRQWARGDIGHWKRTFTIDGVSVIVEFDVQDCTVPPNTLVCTPQNQSANSGQQVSFAAAGGTAPYNWTATNGQSGNGASFSAAFAQSGSATVRSSDGQSATCNVNVIITPPPANLQCAPASQTGTAGQTFSFTATGGNGTYTWTTTGGRSGSGSVFTAPFTQSGSATVRSGDQTVTCNVTVTTMPPPQALACSPRTQSANSGQTVYFVASGGTGTYTWTATNGQQANGSSFSTSFSQNGSATVTSGTQTATCNVTINTPPPPQQVQCIPANQSGSVNQTFYFASSGGNGTYSWSAPSGTVTSGSGNSFSTAYAASGDRQVTVTSNGQSATCNVRVNPIQYPQLVCVPANQTAQVNQGVWFAANGGNGQYTWLASNSTRTSGSGQSFNTTYANPVNNQTVTVTSGDGQSANCNVTILGNPPSQLICTPPTQTASTGQQVYFNALGGTAPYNWNVTNGFTGSGSSVNTTFGQGGTYTATVRSADNQTAQCQVTVTTPSVQVGRLTLTKHVAHYGQNDFNSSITADNGARVTYRVMVTANDAAVNSVILTDVLPANANYIPGTLKLDNSSVNTNSINSVTLGNFAAGQTRTVTFDAYVTAQVGTAQTVITNTAQAAGQSGNQTVTSNLATATVYINVSNNFPQMQIEKTVRVLGQNVYGSGYVCNPAGNAYQQNVNANSGDQVEFRIVITNTGTQTLNSVVLSDFWTGSVSMVTGSVRVDCSSASDTLGNGSVTLGDMAPGQVKRVTFVAAVSGQNQTVQNTAKAQATNFGPVQSTATVFVRGQVLGGNVNLIMSKGAVNVTKNGASAMQLPANKEDYITYTLTVRNTGNADATNFVITDDLSQVLPYADITDNGGGTVSGNVITFPAITVPQGGTVSKSFTVRVKSFLSEGLSYTMINTYGNTITISINTPQVRGGFTSPQTGANTTGLAFAGMLTASFALYRKRKNLMKLILA